MIRNVLSHLGGIEIYGILSILIFFTFFAGMLVWAFRLKRSHLDSMGELPLHDDVVPDCERPVNPTDVEFSTRHE